MRYLNSLPLLACLVSAPVWADCSPSQPFADWLQGFKSEALAAGLRPEVLSATLDGMTPDKSVIQRDRSQQTFALDFLSFSAKKVVSYRLNKGRELLGKNTSLFKRIEREFGVPGEVLASFWGLETDFGGNTGDMPTLRSLATLAWDCRRPEMFRTELLAALQLVQKGDLTPAKMRGAWAGELGQLQLLASRYDQYAVDFDGDGRRDLIHSSADALASAASMLKNAGWRAGEPWLKEVKVPHEMDWSQARLDNKLSVSEWGSRGVTTVEGAKIGGTGMAALLLPMGRNGPAFLAFPNFDVFLAWNESTVYSATAAYFATRLAGAKPLRAGNAPVASLTMGQTKQLQATLKGRGFPVTKVDGIIGEETRNAVRQIQQELKLPADGYPDAGLLGRM
ncbi:MAG: lytic murein transglycosylase [Thiothrix sp.]|uniref:lytic murein transglycosylase n=1 Tax=Thiothrix sp. TaxID=1032 RepID=UPI002636DB62|nr:lytic murein transglycosylase [Thiothrix sp.]MDD5393971.1 lytic murein transglycosylase [Thiothrix sp.]